MRSRPGPCSAAPPYHGMARCLLARGLVPRYKGQPPLTAIISLIVLVVIGAIVWWVFRKILHFGFLIAIGLIALFGWWFFFVR